ncbi:flagellar hook-associated protein FlgK [Sedimentitalea todarodis]|uniref:Flagellar hook-associated protein 1 n=1 Tax=Sedimentitalea todarodis TaxID=1631240 RepID=A0ABU3VAF0_9RHOB|nr:flagellar hook-associated protein FlgK [Sedimentitalea todarodis]MDU9003153.1 flagellar hook-associated protein FlgK [Sedimentitalea todarodis]
MSISSALNSALSGLNAASRASGIVSDNLANVMTPGYARRSLELSSAAETGPGVRVVGVHRHSDPVILSDRRSADAERGNAQVLSDFHVRFETLVGDGTDTSSLGMRLAKFESSLITAASNPDSTQRLDTVAYAAKDLAGAINVAAEGLRNMRSQADATIGAQVEQLNQTLGNVQKLNARITSTLSSGGDVSALQDQRQSLVDQINTIVPINVVERNYGQIALYTDGGAILIDGPSAELGFSPASDTVPEMTLSGGGLSGLTVNGIPVTERAIAGGTLAANFEIRDDVAVSAQTDLDAMARDLIERFETTTLDPTTPAGEPGLFTDAGVVFDPANEIGLANRLSLNTLVDPTEVGESWRLRAGLGAADPGESGDARQLKAFSAILQDGRATGSSVFGTGLASAADIASDLTSRVAVNSDRAAGILAFASVNQTEMARIEAAQGVDTDAELQQLMIVERAYAANARMIQTIDEMMETLLRL